jgi:IS30 family transposase
LRVLVTLAERRTRYSAIAKVPDKSVQAVTDALLTALQPHADLVHTLTYDNGKEFAYHQTISEELDAQGYFAHPYHSWERGLNENTNGLIRQYLPKGTDFHARARRSAASMDLLNNRPRKCLGFKTPNQLFSGINPPVALTS